jgi:hypothetical protein
MTVSFSVCEVENACDLIVLLVPDWPY